MKINLNKNLLGTLIVLGGIFGTIAAFTIILNKIELLKDPNFVPTCAINPWLDCGTVMKSKWGSMFGFPNAIIGLMVYPLAIWTGLYLMVQENINVKFLKFCTLLAGLGFFGNNILTYISSSIIFSLCPWCLLAHTSTVLVFFSLVTYLVLQNEFFKNESRSTVWQQRFQNAWSIWITFGYFLLVLIYVLTIYELFANSIIKEPLPDPIFWLWSK